MTDTPLHEWLTPRLQKLVREAEQTGFPRSTIVAVITDLITGPGFDPSPADHASPPRPGA